ncbi:hypothetical protein [Kribbella sp. CA-247076]|uniref:hypothetical protein n=1 Tax=Kribbella sp. CA-247076 TaxID=3239941 RepID=UPI003D8B1A1B
MTTESSMPRLEGLFKASAGKPVEFNGSTVYLAYGLKLGARQVDVGLRVKSDGREPVQGICVEIDDGQLELNGAMNAGMVLWMDVAPPEMNIRAGGASDSILRVWNCWRGKFGQRDAWIGNAGMLVDAQADGIYRFRCSDGPGAPDFTALEFELRLSE